MTWQEGVAVVSYAWSVWLLSENKPLGWWVGLVGTGMYAWVFYEARLYGEIAIQAFFFVTSLWGIWIWLHGGERREEKPVGRASPRLLAASAAIGLASLAAVYAVLVKMRGAAPFWDSLTTVVSFIAQFYLMWRYVESWHLWLAVDLIYVPLYASRGLYATSALYAVFVALAWRGLKNFEREWREGRGAAPEPAAGPESAPEPAG